MMFIHISCIVMCLFEIAVACLPTQQAETTTTTTTTTPVPTCVTCLNKYDQTCPGYIYNQPWCSTESDAMVTYTIGSAVIDAAGTVDPAACILTFTCPSTTVLFIDGDSTTSFYWSGTQSEAYCRESGAGAGQWYMGNWVTPPQVPEAFTYFRCHGSY